MFTLRRMTVTGVEMNRAVGDEYTLLDRERNYNEFADFFKHHFKKEHVADMDDKADCDTKECYAFVINGSFVQPLYKVQKAYIMTSDGKTFSNLSFK